MYGFDKKAVCLYQSGLWQGHKRSVLIISSMNCTIFSFGTSSTKESSENHENRTQFLVFSLSFFEKICKHFFGNFDFDLFFRFVFPFRVAGVRLTVPQKKI